MVERALGEILPISVGTALAIEVLVKEEKPLQYDTIFYNVRTLFRNFMGSFEDSSFNEFSYVRDNFLAELQLIESTTTSVIKGNMTPVFYICSCKSMERTFKFAKLKQSTTDRQKNSEYLERAVMEWLVQKTEFGKKVKIFDIQIKGNNTKALILTHYPLDLLSQPKFRKLDLLESQTGAIKTPDMWNSKLTNSATMRNMPFNILTIQLYGDNAKQFNSMGIKYTSAVSELAVKNKWNPTTGVQQMRFQIDKLKDKLLVNVLNEMASVTLR